MPGDRSLDGIDNFLGNIDRPVGDALQVTSQEIGVDVVTGMIRVFGNPRFYILIAAIPALM